MLGRLFSIAGEMLYSWKTGRHPKWPEFQEKLIEKHPYCSICGTTDRQYLLGHHIIPYHVDKSKELDEDNILIVCRSPTHNDHLIFCHLLNFKSWNPNIVEDAKIWLNKIKNRP